MLSPLLSQAILEARVEAQAVNAKPLAVLYAPRLSDAMNERLVAFVQRVAPKQAWVAADALGRVFFHFPDQPDIEPPPRRPLLSAPPRARRQVSLFSDLHQWMLKVLFGPQFKSELLAVPRERPIRNASILAEIAEVSVPAAARFVHALEKAGHLDRSYGDLRIAEPQRLLESWLANVPSSFREEREALFVRGPMGDIEFDVLSKMAPKFQHKFRRVVGLFSACEMLGLGHVRGGPRHLYVDSVDQRFLDELGLVLSGPHERADVVLRVPKYPESIFGAAPSGATDVIQCWLDVSRHPVRGEEQAKFIWRKAIAPAIDAK